MKLVCRYVGSGRNIAQYPVYLLPILRWRSQASNATFSWNITTELHRLYICPFGFIDNIKERKTMIF